MLDKLRRIGFDDRRNQREDRRARMEEREAEVVRPTREETRRAAPAPSREESVRHPDYPGQDPEYHHAGRGGGVGERAESIGTIAPVMGNPSLDPATGDPVAVSYMCGYGGETPVGYDAMEGVGAMALGWVDANRELEADSITPGGPLEVAPFESVYDDASGAGTHDTRLTEGEANGDWCGCLRTDRRDRGWV